MSTVYQVIAAWDAEAGVWVATSDDVPGLVAEAATVEGLLDDLRALIPELLELNAVPHPASFSFRLTADRAEAIGRTA
jgi:predicted RNase H-like HicB family nuclease